LQRAEAAAAENPPDLQTALREVNEAIEANEGFWPAHLFRGLVLGQMGRSPEALESFLRATSLSPGQPAAHRGAAIAAYNEQQYELAWANLVQAIHAGDEQATGLIQAMIASVPPPPDLDAQLTAARIFLAPLDTGLYDSAVDLRTMGGVSRRDPRLMNQTAASDTDVDFYELARQMRQALVTSRLFGLVPREDMAGYTMTIEIHDVGGNVTVGAATSLSTGQVGIGNDQANGTPNRSGPRSVNGYIKLRDLQTDDVVYSRLLDLANMSAIADLHADMSRHVEFLEVWVMAEKR
jgi:tetratricopeptide (TPR) repeat protein